jgi:DNA polymerase-3 subunit gamma/tau
LLQFTVIIREDPNREIKVEGPLSSKDQFIRMVEKYPLVKELKDKLGLELDY